MSSVFARDLPSEVISELPTGTPKYILTIIRVATIRTAPRSHRDIHTCSTVQISAKQAVGNLHVGKTGVARVGHFGTVSDYVTLSSLAVG